MRRQREMAGMRGRRMETGKHSAKEVKRREFPRGVVISIDAAEGF